MYLSDIEMDIFVHDIMNPPHEDSGSKVILNLQKSMGLIKLVPKFSELNQFHYTVLIIEPTMVGFTSSEQHILQRELDDFPSIVEKNIKGTSVHVFENIDIRDHVSIEVTTSDTLSESEVIDTFKKLKKFKRYEEKKGKRENNLSLALKHFEAAISDFERLFKFTMVFWFDVDVKLIS
jgi:hypothetical protein